MKKLAILSGTALLLFVSSSSLPVVAGVKGEVIFSQDFESTICGGRPKNIYDNWGSNPTNEQSRYVTNVDAATGEKSLMCDFSQLKPVSRIQRANSWHERIHYQGDPTITNGWIQWSISVKRLSGEMNGEIRSDIGSRIDPKHRRDYWIAYWINFGEEFTVRNEARDAKTISIGALPKGRWCKIDLMLPLPANRATNAWGRISVKGHNGKFKSGPRVEIPLGDMRLLRGYSLMQIAGDGTAKWMIDDISLTHIK